MWTNLSNNLRWLWESLGLVSAPTVATPPVIAPLPVLGDALASTPQDSLWTSLLSQATLETALLAGCFVGLYGVYWWLTRLPAIQPDIPAIQPDIPAIQPDIPAIQPDIPAIIHSDALPTSMPSAAPMGSDYTSTFQDSLWTSLPGALEMALLAGCLVGLYGVYWWLTILPKSVAPFVPPMVAPVEHVVAPVEHVVVPVEHVVVPVEHVVVPVEHVVVPVEHVVVPVEHVVAPVPLNPSPWYHYIGDTVAHVPVNQSDPWDWYNTSGSDEQVLSESDEQVLSQSSESGEPLTYVFSKDAVLMSMEEALSMITQTQYLLGVSDQMNALCEPSLFLTNPLEEAADIFAQQYTLLNTLGQQLLSNTLEQKLADGSLAILLTTAKKELLMIKSYCATQPEDYFTDDPSTDKEFFINEYLTLREAMGNFIKILDASLAAPEGMSLLSTEAPMEPALAAILEPVQGILLTVLVSLGVLRCTGSRRLSAPRVTLSLGGLGLSLATSTLLLYLGQTLLLSLVVAVLVRLVVVLVLRRRWAWFRQS